MEIKDEIAAWVRTARKHAGLSGEALGGKLALELRAGRGYSKANISHWELGRHQPSLSQLLAISKITGCALPPTLMQHAENEADLINSRPDKIVVQAAPGYEFLLNHISTALMERDVPPHIQSTIMTLLDTCPLKAK